MSKQVAVIGLGRFGTNLAIILHDAGYQVLAIDKGADLVETISSQVTHAVRANSTSETALRKLGIGSFDVAVVTIGASIQDSVMTTILLKKLGVRYIVARADNELHRDILESIGVHKIIFPEKDMAIKTGPILTMRDVTDYIPLGNGSGIIKIKAPRSFIGKTLEHIGLSSASKSGIVVLMIQRGKEVIPNPAPQEVISLIDILILVGNNNDIEKLLERAEREEWEEQKKGHNGLTLSSS